MSNDLVLRRVLAVLLVATAALFAIGVAVEGGEGQHSETVDTERHSETEGEGNSESGEQERSGETSDEETLLGVDVESPALVIAAVVASLILAATVLWRPSRPLFAAVAIVSLVFLVNDVAEAVHKFEESEAGIGVLASIVALGHLGAAAIATQLARKHTTAAV